jgi:hypothetical protein
LLSVIGAFAGVVACTSSKKLNGEIRCCKVIERNRENSLQVCNPVVVMCAKVRL